MLHPTTTERSADFWSDRQLQQFNDAAEAEHDTAYKKAFDAGLAQAEHDLAEFAMKFVADDNETTEERCRRFLAEYIGYLDCSWSDLSAALSAASGLFEDGEA